MWNPDERLNVEEALRHEYFRSSIAPRTVTGIGNEIGGSNNNSNARDRWSIKSSTNREDSPRHQIGEIVVAKKQPEKHSSNTLSSKIKARPPMSFRKTAQPENEFNAYLNACSKSTESGKYRPSGNKIRPIFPGCRQNDGRQHEQSEDLTLTNPFHPYSDMPTASAGRSRIAQATNNIGIKGGKSARKRTTKPKRHNKRNYGHAAEKPRWLLSNANMGKRAMEVSISTFSLAVGGGRGEEDHKPSASASANPNECASRKPSAKEEHSRNQSANPFTCLY